MLSHFGIIVSMASGILGILVIMLGFVVRATIKWTVISTKVSSMETSLVVMTDKLAGVILELAVATHVDGDLERRIGNLEVRKR